MAETGADFKCSLLTCTEAVVLLSGLSRAISPKKARAPSFAMRAPSTSTCREPRGAPPATPAESRGVHPRLQCHLHALLTTLSPCPTSPRCLGFPVAVLHPGVSFFASLAHDSCGHACDLDLSSLALSELEQMSSSPCHRLALAAGTSQLPAPGSQLLRTSTEPVEMKNIPSAASPCLMIKSPVTKTTRSRIREMCPASPLSAPA